MMCELCHDTTGPFEIIDHDKRCKLVCEDCADRELKRKHKMITSMRKDIYLKKRKEGKI